MKETASTVYDEQEEVLHSNSHVVNQTEPNLIKKKYLSRGDVARTSLKEAVLLRKQENERTKKNRWNVSRFSSSDGAIELRDNTENIRKKLLQNRKELDDLLRRFPNVIPKSQSDHLDKGVKPNDLTNRPDPSVPKGLKQLNGNHYDHPDESSSDEDLRAPMEESHPELSDEDCLRSGRVTTSQLKVNNDEVSEDIILPTYSSGIGASKARTINVTRTSIRSDSPDNQLHGKAPGNHLYEAAKPRPPPRRTHYHIKKIMLRKAAEQSNDEINGKYSPSNGENFTKPQIVTLPYVSRGTAKNQLYRSNKSQSVNNETAEYSVKGESLKERNLKENFAGTGGKNEDSRTDPLLHKKKKDISPSRGTMSSSGYSSLNGSSSLSPSTSNASSTMSSSANVSSSERHETDLIDTRRRSGTQTSGDSETTRLKTLIETHNDNNSISSPNIDEDDVFPVTTWVESEEYKTLDQEYYKKQEDAKRLKNRQSSKKSSQTNKTTRHVTSRAREALPQRPQSAYIVPSGNSICMVEQSEEVKTRTRAGSGHIKLRFPGAISRSKKSAASRNSRAFALQARSQSDISSLDYADGDNLAASVEKFNRSAEEDDVRRVASLSPSSFASDQLTAHKRDISASLADLPRVSSSEKHFNTVSGATGRHLSERSNFFMDETLLRSTNNNNNLYRSSPLVYSGSSWSLNPSNQNQKSSDQKSSFRNRIKGAFSFQNIRKAISMEKLDDEERAKSVSHCYLNEFGEDISQVTKPKAKSDSLPRGGKLYKPSSVTSIMNTVRMRKRKSRERREAKARNTIAIDPRVTPEFEHLSSKQLSRNSYNDDVGTPAHFRPIGQVLEMDHRKGTLLVKMIKPPSGPFGFYLARRKESGSVYISSMSDSYPDKMYVGLMKLGDEITEINGIEVSSLSLEQIYDLILENTTLLLRIKPTQVHSV